MTFLGETASGCNIVEEKPLPVLQVSPPGSLEGMLCIFMHQCFAVSYEVGSSFPTAC